MTEEENVEKELPVVAEALAEAVASEPVEKAVPKTLREEIQENVRAARNRGEEGKTKGRDDLRRDDTLVAPAEKATSKLVAPVSWDDKSKADFASMPLHVQTAIAKREAEMAKGLTRQDEDRVFGKQIKELVTPFSEMIKSEGSSVQQAFGSFLNTAKILRTGTEEEKSSVVKDLIKRYNVRIDVTQAPSNTGFHQNDGMTREQVAQIVKQEQEQSRLLSEVDAFRSDPANEHFDVVRGHMVALLNGGLADTLKSAYDQAVYANPQTRSSLLARQDTSAQDKQKIDMSKKVAAAKAASGSVIGSNNGLGASSKAKGPEMSLRDEIRANLEAARNGRI